MTPEGLALLAGGLLSLVFSYFPKLKDWYEALDGTKKRLIMIGVLLGVSLTVYGVSCTQFAGFLGLPVVACDQSGAVELLKVFLLALIANQSVYSVSPK